MDVLQLKEILLKVNISEIAVQAIRKTNHHAVEWQKDQLWSGKTKKGGFIRPPYRPVTKKIKRAKGQPTDRVTLKDEGDFYGGIIMDSGEQIIRFNSTDEKTPLLTEKYGPDIFGLNKISLAGYRDDVRPVFLTDVHKATGL